MPLYRRVPKFGFKNFNRVEYTAVNLDTLEKLATEHKVKQIDPAVLAAHGLVGKNDLVKVLGRGELKSAVEVKAHAFSEKAKSAVEAAGGSATILA